MQFISGAQTASAPSASTKRHKTAAAAFPDHNPTATAAAAYSLPAQLQQRWVQKTLPAALTHILSCYQYLIGSIAITTTSSSRSRTGRVTGLQLGSSSSSWRLPFSTKQQASMDQVCVHNVEMPLCCIWKHMQ
jgi:hypothetical protein